jgi:GDP/UDP-N,N'-diacetylbacillosamine 2-epimerase (hydrolysing)
LKLGVLTSSRADFGIYLPLLRKLKCDAYFELEIIAFGTHLSKFHGYTLNEIESEQFKKIHTISTILTNDDAQSIASSYGLTCLKFADFWRQNKYDLVFCLGDRYEMNAAVQAGLPFNIKFAHLHGGETTLGAIDNIYRHQITLASTIHFTASDAYSDHVVKLTGDLQNVITVGSLSLNELVNFIPKNKSEFYKNFNIKYKDFALVTFHPETVNFEMNQYFAKEMRIALSQMTSKLFLVITMPNADTMGSIFRNEIIRLKDEYSNQILCIENFGKENYFNAMYFSKVLIGNSSSGIIEAASFGKYVVNVGERQKGRLQSDNIINSSFRCNDIINAVEFAMSKGGYQGENTYYLPNPSEGIIDAIKQYNATI